MDIGMGIVVDAGEDIDVTERVLFLSWLSTEETEAEELEMMVESTGGIGIVIGLEED